MADADGLSKKLRALRERFTAGLPGRIEEVHAAARALSTAHDPETFSLARHALIFPVHKLAGSAAPMGHPILSGIAAELESLLQNIPDDRTGLTAEEAGHVERCIAAMATSAGRLASVEFDDVPDVVAAGTTVDVTRAVVMLSGDRSAGEDMAQQVTNFGYAITVIDDPENFENVARHVRPAALVVDLDVEEGPERGLAALDTVSAYRPDVPVIALTGQTDIHTRLRTVRSGAEAVLTAPVDAHDLVLALDRFTAPDEAPPFRILIVDDDQDMAYFYELTLQGEGMDTRIVTNPLEVLDPLTAFDPDLILMDVNMPQCSGIELSRVIRQNRAFLQIPIVFLTADKSVRSHLFAVRAGGDDYLAKPVDKRLLLASVRARAERARMLKSLITSDSMTGLLNHSAIMEALATELSRARRHARPMAVAMIDIDHFKAVNDTYGHWVGDSVIKAMSQVLRQRLRKTDVIGRYGGEEFVVILSDVDAHTAASLIDRIRDGFGKIRHGGDGEEFFVTFSCGIAAYPAIDEPAALITSADDALYLAKQQGRNRVMVAGACR